MSLFNTGVRPIIDAHLMSEYEKKRDYGNYWSASSAGYCYRKLIFERLGVPEVNPDPRKQRVFSSGHIFHNWIQELTRDAGISIAQEVELQDEDLMVRGHFDDLVLIKTEDVVKVTNEKLLEKGQSPIGILTHSKLILYDYKTRNSRSFNFAKQPMNTHKMQLGTYMYMLRKQLYNFKNIPIADGSALTEARTLNIEKDTLRMAEVQYLWSDELEKEIKDYWDGLNKWWKSKKIPPCTCEGFMASERYNPFFYDGEPCSAKWAAQWKKEQKEAK